MPGLNCSFRIEDVQECDNLLNPFESDDADNDSLNDDVLTGDDSEYSNHSWGDADSIYSGDSGSSDEESSDGHSELSDNRVPSAGRTDADFDVDGVERELCLMDDEQRELAKNLIVAVLHEGVQGRLTQHTTLSCSTVGENDAVPAAPESS